MSITKQEVIQELRRYICEEYKKDVNAGIPKKEMSVTAAEFMKATEIIIKLEGLDKVDNKDAGLPRTAKLLLP